MARCAAHGSGSHATPRLTLAPLVKTTDDSPVGRSSLPARHCLQPALLVAALLAGAVVSGAGMPVQALLNGVMARHLGTPFRASAVSFAGGTLILGALALATGSFGYRVQGGEVHLEASAPWMWTGGLCGALAITGNIIGVGHLGAAAYSALFVSTQLLAASFFDVVGAFGFKPVEFSMRRVAGVVLATSSSVAYQLAPSRLEPKVNMPILQ